VHVVPKGDEAEGRVAEEEDGETDSEVEEIPSRVDQRGHERPDVFVEPEQTQELDVGHEENYARHVRQEFVVRSQVDVVHVLVWKIKKSAMSIPPKLICSYYTIPIFLLRNIV